MFWWTLLTSAVAVTVLLAATLAVALRVGRHSVIDVAWGLGFALVAAVSYVTSDGDAVRRGLLLALTAVWGLRLAAHIGRRNAGEGEDPRYERLLGRAPGGRTAYAIRAVYLTQGAILLFVSLPVQVAMGEPGPLGPLGMLGAALWLVGFAFEAIGDHQLARFRADPATKGKVLDTGLWRYTRHPNYFGDAVVWWGLYLIAAEHWPGPLTVFSPLVMTYFLLAKTGKPLLEEHLTRTRPDYADYVRRTSGFFPLPPKRF
jgi:steroid 5-alpha reductase family enzyme